MREAKDRYVFLRTAEHEGQVVALIADSEILGPRLRDLQLSFNAHAAPIARAGVLTYTAEHLRERLPELEKHGMKQSVEAFRRAIECVDRKAGRAPGPGHDDHRPRAPEPPPQRGSR